MKSIIQMCFVAVFLMLPLFVQGQQAVTIRDLNTYDSLTVFSNAAIQDHPLADSLVTFTAVIVSNPRSSGLATASTDAGGNVTDISRIHVFVTDTSAVSQGRDGMSIQLVESDWELLQNYNRGDIATFTGRLRYFNAGTQVTVDETPVFVGNVNDASFSAYADLLNPWEVNLAELNINNGDGTFQFDIANYTKYNNAYVKINSGTIGNVSLGTRPNWSINANGTKIYAYDTSLRVRNDRNNGYITGFNWRRAPDPEFEPTTGAVANVSGFLTLTGDDPDGVAADGNIMWSINPFEDGVLWTVDENTTEPLRCVNGGLCNGETLVWPNDIEIIGLPPVVSNVALSDSLPTSTTLVTLTADVVAEGAATVASVNLVYTANGVTDTTAMTASGNVYSSTFPTFPNFSAVSFYLETEDSEGLQGRFPSAGTLGFFVQDGPINSIEIVQKTGDLKSGPSPIAGLGQFDVDLSGVIVSDDADGVIVLHDAAAPWSGIALEKTTATKALVRGDSISITKAAVVEIDGNRSPVTLTQLVDLEFTVNSSGNDVEAFVPVITSDIWASLIDGNAVEPYETMVVRLEGVEVTDRSRFGEFFVRNTNADSTSGGVQINPDFRGDAVGETSLQPSDNIFRNVRFGTTFDVTGIVGSSFNVANVNPRGRADFSEGNLFTPERVFNLTAPAADAVVEVQDDIVVTWAASSDFDGNAVTYEWVLYSADSTTVVATVPSDSDATANQVTLTYDVVDGLLGSAGLQNGQSADFVWNVRVSDGLDTLSVATYATGDGGSHTTVYRSLTLTRAPLVSNEEIDGGIPAKFALNQNYPNPFNPTTNISFDLPQAATVELTIFDMLGRKVNTIVSERMNAGSHTVSFDASRLASGMYIYRINAGTFVSTKKMTLIK